MAASYEGRSNEELLEELTEINKQIVQKQKLVDFLRMSNFDMALQCRHMENFLSHAESVTKECSVSLLESSENLCRSIELASGFSNNNEKQCITHANTPGSEKKLKNKKHSRYFPKTSTKPNKAHIVKPHMVNGHILYDPTIHLTRVTNNDIANEAPAPNENAAESSYSFDHGNENQMDGQLDSEESSNEHNNNINQLETVLEQDEASSPQHSSLLSGTFQEVKIYLSSETANSGQKFNFSSAVPKKSQHLKNVSQRKRK